MKLHDSIRECLRQGITRSIDIAEAVGVSQSTLGANLVRLIGNGFTERVAPGQYKLTKKGIARLPSKGDTICELCNGGSGDRLLVIATSDPLTTRDVCGSCYNMLNCQGEGT